MSPTMFSHTFGPAHATPVLIIHGWTCSSGVEIHDFEPILSKTSYRRTYVDLPGMGKTPAFPEMEDLDSILESVESFVEEHILPQRFILVGSSCGAYLARALAYKYANLVDGLLLRVPVVEPATRKRDVVKPFVPAIANSEVISALEDEEMNLMGDIPVQTGEYIGELRSKATKLWAPAIASVDETVLDIIRNDPEKYRLRASLHSPEEQFCRPTLIVTGRQDSDVGYKDAWGIIECYPRATFVVLDRGSHGYPVDESERRLFEALVQNWLGRIAEM